MSTDWTELPADLLHAVSKKLIFYADYLRFRATCRTWRLATPRIPTHLPTQLPWLMLPPSQANSSSSTRAFFDLSSDRVHFLTIPEASNRRRHCGSSHGWLVLLDESPEVLLLNPVSGAKLRLPPLSSFPSVVAFSYFEIGREYVLLSSSGHRYSRNLRQMRDSFIKKVVLSSSPASDPGFLAIAILNQTGELAYCRNGDEVWKLIKGARSYSEDVIFYNDMFYAVDKYGAIAVMDLRDGLPRVSLMTMPRQFGGDMQYLVGSDDDLLLATRFLDMEFDYAPGQPHLVYRTSRFEIFRLNRIGCYWERVRDLGDRVLFVGENSSLSLPASDFPGGEGNCVYFTDDYSETNYDGAFGEHDLGIYRLYDGRIDSLPCYPSNSFYQLRWPPPVWVTPNPY